jgi:hypothetical protein
LTSEHRRRGDDIPICEHHQELADNQVEIAAHLQWLRDAGKWGLRLMGACLIVLLGIGGTVIKVGWDLSLSEQSSRHDIARLGVQVNKLEETDKTICSKIDKLEKDHVRFGIKAGSGFNGGD